MASGGVKFSGIDDPVLAAYGTREVAFRFRSVDLRFILSHGLFSSADIDSGSRLLLRSLSTLWDEDRAAGRPLPRSVLDSGCGVGVLGIAAAAALRSEPAAAPLRVRAQDRDELARAFTQANAAINGLGTDLLTAHAESLLAGPADEAWDLILSNVPAKAGAVVLADFVYRSARRLNAGGRVATVVVEPLAEAFRLWIRAAGAPLLREERGAEHRVFVYGAAPAEQGPASRSPAEAGDDPGPAYARSGADFSLEGLSYHIDALHGVADFDTPSTAAALAAKLTVRLAAIFDLAAEDRLRVLVHEGGQGHYPAWLAVLLRTRTTTTGRRPEAAYTLCGRNVLALHAARRNLRTALARPESPADNPSSPAIVPVVDPAFLPGSEDYDLIVSFPVSVPRTERGADLWAAAARLLRPGGLLVLALPSTDAQRLDRLKPAAFVRAGDLRRDGYRALGYRKA